MSHYQLSLRDRFQIAAFQAFYRAAQIGGKDRYQCFIAGICGSCDLEVDRLLAENPTAIEEWQAKTKEMKRRKRRNIK